MKRLKKIKEVTIKRPYIYSFIIVFLSYLTINVIVNKFYVVAPYVFSYNLKIVIPQIILNLIVATLVATNINMIYSKFKELNKIKKSSGLTFFGIFSGLLGGLCPGCFVGLFPLVLSFFGVTASLASLPLKGIELQVLSIILLTIAIILLTKENKTCKNQNWR